MLTNQSEVSCIIVDDEEDSIILLSSLLYKIEEVVVLDAIMDSSKVMDSILSYKPDMVFLDIELGSANGLDILQKIRNMKLKIQVVFVTAHDNYAIQALNLGTTDYLLKPISVSDLKGAVIKFLENRRLFGFYNQPEIEFNKECYKIRIPTNKGIFYYNCDEIVYLEAERNYTHIYLNNGEKVFSGLNLGKLESCFPVNFFVKLSRSCIINKIYLFKIEKSKRKCYLKLDKQQIELKISDKYFKEALI